MNNSNLNHFWGMILCRFLLLLSILALPIWGNDLYWVFLDNANESPDITLTQRAQDRLALRGSVPAPGSQIISPEILAEIRNTGVQIRHASRFLNAVSVQVLGAGQLSRLNAIPFVSKLKPLARLTSSEPQLELSTFRTSSTDYGFSQMQNELLEIPQIHDLGYDGSGVLIAVFDAGFYTAHPTFADLDIVAQYDFVDREPDPAGVGHEHGINVLSALAGYSPGQLVGPAYGASFLLARTENDIGESRAEEDNWIEALEWADSLGADIVSSSLNYREFDNPADDYPYSALDGQTAAITLASNVAAQRGILIVNCIGNEGPSTGSLWPPADSPHVLAVGGVSAAGTVMYFSGRGPSFDGRIKPDVVAMASNVYVASGTQSFRQVSGTSFAAPVTAGLAALLLEADPSRRPDEMISLFKTRSDQFTSPDNNHGYGIPKMSALFTQKLTHDKLLIFPNPHDGYHLNIALPEGLEEPVIAAHLFDIRGGKRGSPRFTLLTSEMMEIDLTQCAPLSSQLYILTLTTQSRSYSAKLIHLH